MEKRRKKAQNEWRRLVAGGEKGLVALNAIKILSRHAQISACIQQSISSLILINKIKEGGRESERANENTGGERNRSENEENNK